MLESGPDDVKFEHYTYIEKIRFLRVMILQECKIDESKRAIINHDDITKLQEEKVLYEKMHQVLIECRERNAFKTPKPSTILPKTTTTNLPSTEATTTAPSMPQPPECQSAINLTEYWRIDHKGSRINQGNENCDPKVMDSQGRPWFRFSGAAGNMMLDTCPPSFSCGTHGGMWTNDAMPTNIGVQKSINAYGSYSSNCKYATRLISVVRCSSKAGDFVYKYTDTNTSCSYSFCGMSGIN